MVTARTPPSGSEARRLQEELASLWAPSFRRDQRMRDLVNLKNVVELLPISSTMSIQPVQLHSGRAGSLIDHAQSFVVSLPSVSIEPRDQLTETRRESEQSERFFQALFNEQLIANGFWSNLGRSLLLTGRGVLQTLPFPAAWTAAAGFPVRQPRERGESYIDRVNTWKNEEGKTPILMQSIPSDDILLKLDNNDTVLAALETKLISASVVADSLGSSQAAELLQRGTLKHYDQLPVLQYMDDIYVCYFLITTKPVRQFDTTFTDARMATFAPDSQPYKSLKSWEHGLGKCPVVFIPGVKTDEKEYELRFKPFLADAEEDLEMYDFLMSRLATMVKAFYFPSFIWKYGRNSNEFLGQDRPEEDVNLGGTTVEYSDEDITVLQPPPNLPDASLLAQELESLIQRNTLEDVLFGKVQGSAPAFAIRLRINVAKNKLVPHVTHMALGLTESFDLVTRAVEQLGEEVIVNGEYITPKMAILARGRIGVNVDPKLPGEEGIDLQKAAMALNLRLPEPWVWEHILGIADPATLALFRDVLELEEDPEVKARLIRDGLENLQARIEEEETTGILEALDKIGNKLDPEVVMLLEQLVGRGQPGGTPGGAPEGAPGGLGRGPYPPGASNQAVGGGRGLGTPKAPRPGMEAVEPAAVGNEPEF